MKYKKTICIFSAFVMILLSGCGSDYPVVNRKLDISGFLNACFEGSGYNVSIDEAEVVVSAVGDRMHVELDASSQAADSVREKLRSSASSDYGIVGVWKGQLNISPVVCRSFESIKGLKLHDSIGEIIVPAELTFTEDGYYFIRFPSAEIDRADKSMRSGAVKATKDFLDSSGGVGKIISRAVSDSTLEDALGYVVDVMDQMLKNGASGSYSCSGSTVSFDAKYKFDCIMTGNSLTLTGSADSGMLECIGPGPIHFEKAF